MELQKAAVIAMLESYAGATTGSVNIKLVQFSNDASFFGGTDASRRSSTSPIPQISRR